MAPTVESKALTILYVEDESIIRKNVETCLNYMFNVIVAKNGQEGLNLFNTNNIDLVVTDVSMPGKSGISMIEEIKEIKPNIPCIITTAHELEVLKDFSSLDCQYIKKPFDVKFLMKSAMKTLKI